MSRLFIIIIAFFQLGMMDVSINRTKKQVEGFYCKFRGGQDCLILPDLNKPVHLKIGANLESLLGRLTPGDYISGLGTLLPPNEVELSEIHNVGLIRLVGRWIDKQGRIYQFTNFDALAIYESQSDSKPSERYTFSLSPSSSGPGWNLLLFQNDNKEWGVWRLYIVDDKLELQVIDGPGKGSLYTLTYLAG